ncbi:hypothetical protein LJC33_00320 [Eubacteriales bacterium OttesenSCG-928-N13]|nr:hypothetical protein [Eubacteriales bacterium OttesenSCG-928-N13]
MSAAIYYPIAMLISAIGLGLSLGAAIRIMRWPGGVSSRGKRRERSGWRASRLIRRR